MAGPQRPAVDALIAFVIARLDEDDRELVKDPPHGLGYADLTARMRRDIMARRALVAAYSEVCHYDTADPEPEYAVGRAAGLGEAVRHLAAAWSEHPQYDVIRDGQ